MIPPQPEYIINEGQLQRHMQICVAYGQTDDIRKTRELSDKLDILEVEIRSHPVKSAAGDAVLDELEKKIDELHYAWVSVDALKRVIAELRSKTKEP